MKDLNPSDVFEIRPQTILSSQDYDYLYELYAPIVGAKSISVFLSMFHWPVGEIISHESFLKRNKISITDLIESLEGLEATGLVVTYRKSEPTYQYLVYCLYSPRNPKEFFDNVLFAGTLSRFIGDQECEKIARKYFVVGKPEDMDDYSTTYQEYFNPDFQDEVYIRSTKTTGGKTIGKVSLIFDRNSFMKQLKTLDPRFNFDAFGKAELIRIARIATLYNYDEKAMASMVRESYSFDESLSNRVDFDHLNKLADQYKGYSFVSKAVDNHKSDVSGSSQVAKGIKKMDDMSPIEFLSKRQRGAKPAKPDVDLIRTLTVDIGLSNGACNALIAYVLETHNNTLPSALTQKIAASIVREGLYNALDVMNYLTKVADSNQKPKGKKSGTKKPIEIVVEATKKSAEEDVVKEPMPKLISEEDIDDFLDNLDLGEE